MKTKDLKINFRYLGGNIACLSVDSIDGKSIHNDINNEEAIIIFNSLVGEKENCQTVKKLLQENQELKEKLDKYENPKDLTLFAMWCTEKVKDENQELKLELSGYRQAILNNEEMLGLKEQNDKLKKKYENAVADYETTMAEKNELNKQLEVSNELVTQNTLTKMKLCDEVNRLRKEYQDTYKDVRIEIKEYKNQQKEFIKWLEDETKQEENKNTIELLSDPNSCRTPNLRYKENILKEILQKYKSIIGVSNENTIK